MQQSFLHRIAVYKADDKIEASVNNNRSDKTEVESTRQCGQEKRKTAILNRTIKFRL